MASTANGHIKGGVLDIQRYKHHAVDGSPQDPGRNGEGIPEPLPLRRRCVYILDGSNQGTVQPDKYAVNIGCEPGMVTLTYVYSWTGFGS